MSLLPGVASRGFPDAFCDHLKNKVHEIEHVASQAATMYAEEMIKQEPTDYEDKDCVVVDIEKVEAMAKQLDETLLSARKGVFADIKKNCGQ